MKIIQLTLHINSDECETIIDFIDELKTVLLANYAQEIQEVRRANYVKNIPQDDIIDKDF